MNNKKTKAVNKKRTKKNIIIIQNIIFDIQFWLDTVELNTPLNSLSRVLRRIQI